MDMVSIMYSCKACGAFYDGFCQCCFEMDHVAYEVNSKTNQIIKQLNK